MEYLTKSDRKTYCEWKELASYYNLTVGDITVSNIAWYYEEIFPDYEQLKGHLGFYPQPMDDYYFDGEKYAGWITSDIVGPFKGEPGTRGW